MIMFKKSITKEELDELPLRWFTGDIYVIDKYKQIDNVAKYLSEQTVLGFDTETRPSFKKGNVNSVALLQFSTNNDAFLIRINKLGLPESIVEILKNPDIIKPGVAIHDDIKALQEISGFEPAGFVELQDYAKETGIENFSLKKLAAIVLGFRISKSQQLSNWEAVRLTEAQRIYAATDAWTALNIYREFL